jgi:hypothetical protein
VRAEVVRGELLEPPALTTGLTGVEAVMHAAADTSEGGHGCSRSSPSPSMARAVITRDEGTASRHRAVRRSTAVTVKACSTCCHSPSYRG